MLQPLRSAPSLVHGAGRSLPSLVYLVPPFTKSPHALLSIVCSSFAFPCAHQTVFSACILKHRCGWSCPLAVWRAFRGLPPPLSKPDAAWLAYWRTRLAYPDAAGAATARRTAAGLVLHPIVHDAACPARSSCKDAEVLHKRQAVKRRPACASLPRHRPVPDMAAAVVCAVGAGPAHGAMHPCTCLPSIFYPRQTCGGWPVRRWRTWWGSSLRRSYQLRSSSNMTTPGPYFFRLWPSCTSHDVCQGCPWCPVAPPARCSPAQVLCGFGFVGHQHRLQVGRVCAVGCAGAPRAQG